MDPELQKALNYLGEQHQAALDIANGEVTKLHERLDAMELAGQRPLIGQPTPADEAFVNFIRGGREAMSDTHRNMLQKSDDTAGGYIVAPAQFETTIIKTLTEYSPIRQYATVTNISASGVILPKQTEAPTAHWVGETEQRPETSMAYGQLNIPIHEAACYVDVSVQLLEDAAVNIEQEVAIEFGKAFARLEAAAHMVGDGHKKPLGILNTPGIETVASGTAATITADAMLDLFYALPDLYSERGTYLANRLTKGKVRKAKSGDGSYLWSDSLQTGTPPSFNGRPFITDQSLPNVGAGLKPVVFGDLSAYRIFDRVTLAILRDPISQAGNGLVRFWGRRRTGGGLVNAEAVKVMVISES